MAADTVRGLVERKDGPLVVVAISDQAVRRLLRLTSLAASQAHPGHRGSDVLNRVAAVQGAARLPSMQTQAGGVALHLAAFAVRPGTGGPAQDGGVEGDRPVDVGHREPGVADVAVCR